MYSQDARPFIDLEKDVEELKEKLDEDRKKCTNFLHSKITALISDPDSLGNSSQGVKLNALVEFSKAKYDIFLDVKNFMNEIERGWLKYISEMKKLFIENVEIFLAHTKLEVTLPKYEDQSNSRKSPENRRLSSVTASIHPLINTITNNLSSIVSPIQSKYESVSSKETFGGSPNGLLHVNAMDDEFSSSEEEMAATRRAVVSLPKLGNEWVVLSKDERTEDAVRDERSGRKVTARNYKQNIEESAESDERLKRKVAAKNRRNNVEESAESSGSKSPKKVTFQEDIDFDDLDISRPIKSMSKRKTMIPRMLEDTSDLDMDIEPRNQTRLKSKRKTIGGISELSSAVPPKRLKVGDNKGNVSHVQDKNEEADDNLLEDGNYSDWFNLKNVNAKIPTEPAVYEVKFARGKKTAFIGFCENLRHKLTLYKLQEKSGHKHLDKFILKNMNNIIVRYEIMSSTDEAKAEVKNRIASFVTQYKTTPAFN